MARQLKRTRTATALKAATWTTAVTAVSWRKTATETSPEQGDMSLVGGLKIDADLPIRLEMTGNKIDILG